MSKPLCGGDEDQTSGGLPEECCICCVPQGGTTAVSRLGGHSHYTGETTERISQESTQQWSRQSHEY